MKHIYINSRLDSLLLSASREARNWIFSLGRPWLLLTPPRLGRLADRLGLEDARVARLVRDVNRHSPHPESYCRTLGIPAARYYDPEDFPPVLCPVCDSVHAPHPADADQPCEACQDARRQREALQPGIRVREERERDREVRAALQETNPELFFRGELSPNWKINQSRRLERDWEAAIGRILRGEAYRRVAAEFNCSVGLLHRKVHERKHWENN